MAQCRCAVRSDLEDFLVVICVQARENVKRPKRMELGQDGGESGLQAAIGTQRIAEYRERENRAHDVLLGKMTDKVLYAPRTNTQLSQLPQADQDPVDLEPPQRLPSAPDQLLHEHQRHHRPSDSLCPA